MMQQTLLVLHPDLVKRSYICDTSSSALMCFFSHWLISEHLQRPSLGLQRAWEFQFSWGTISYISEFLYKIRGLDLKSDTCVTMASSSLLLSFSHTFTSFSLGTLLCKLHAQSSLCLVCFLRPCQ